MVTYSVSLELSWTVVKNSNLLRVPVMGDRFCGACVMCDVSER